MTKNEYNSIHIILQNINTFNEADWILDIVQQEDGSYYLPEFDMYISDLNKESLYDVGIKLEMIDGDEEIIKIEYEDY